MQYVPTRHVLPSNIGSYYRRWAKTSWSCSMLVRIFLIPYTFNFPLSSYILFARKSHLFLKRANCCCIHIIDKQCVRCSVRLYPLLPLHIVQWGVTPTPQGGFTPLPPIHIVQGGFTPLSPLCIIQGGFTPLSPLHIIQGGFTPLPHTTLFREDVPPCPHSTLFREALPPLHSSGRLYPLTLTPQFREASPPCPHSTLLL